MKIEFGTDGWRGLLERELNEENIARVAAAFVRFLMRFHSGTLKNGIAIGYDGRKKSKEFAMLFARVLKDGGILPYLSNKIIPTPCLSYFVYANKFPAGVMITASHNPPEYNGIKFKMGSGGPFSTEQTKEVEKLIMADVPYPVCTDIRETDLLSPYLAQIHKLINFDAIRRAGVKVAIDSMGGAGQTILEELLIANGIPAVTLCGFADENFFGRQPEPIEKNLGNLREFLKSNKEYALGVATDGDADRLGVLDEEGNWFSAQKTILALADYVKLYKKMPGHLVKTSSVTSKIFLLAGPDTEVHEVQVGFKYICEKMIETGAVFGAEESGGFGFTEHIPERDGIYSALKLIECIAKRDFRTISGLNSHLLSSYGEIFYDRIDSHYDGDDRLSKLPDFAEKMPAEIGGYKIVRHELFNSSRGVVNGIKIFLGDLSRWLLLRASETEPLIRIYCEGNSGDEVRHILETAHTIIHTKT